MCLQVLPASAFYKYVTGRCRECHKAKVKENRVAKSDYYLVYDRQRADRADRVAAREAYRKTPVGKANMRKGSKAWELRNPEKKKATTAVHNALRNGKLMRQPCEVCGTEKAQAHHDDYSKPLDVRWFCTTHYAEHHRYSVATTTTADLPQSLPNGHIRRVL